MTLEPWVFRTGLTILALNCVNALLFWIARRRQRQSRTRHLHAQNVPFSDRWQRSASLGYPLSESGLAFRRAFAPAGKARPLRAVSSAGPSPTPRQAATATE